MSKSLASGNQAILARRYVGALYALAEKEGAVDAVAADLRSLRQLWEQSAEWRFIASDPRTGFEAASKAAVEVVRLSGIGKLAANFLRTVARNRRLALLPTIIAGFLEETAVRRGESRAVVRVARSLSAAQSAALAASLVALAGGKVRVTLVEDASILGGMTVRMGTKFIDASVKTKLDHLERTLKGAA